MVKGVYMMMKHWKKGLALGLTAVAMLSAFALAGCGSDKQAGSSSGKMQTLSVGLMPDTDSLPFLIAEEKGYFADEGLTVDIQQERDGPRFGHAERQPRWCRFRYARGLVCQIRRF